PPARVRARRRRVRPQWTDPPRGRPELRRSSPRLVRRRAGTDRACCGSWPCLQLSPAATIRVGPEALLSTGHWTAPTGAERIERRTVRDGDDGMDAPRLEGVTWSGSGLAQGAGDDGDTGSDASCGD